MSVRANPPAAATAKPAPASPTPATQPSGPAKPVAHFNILEYQVHGNDHLLTQIEFERAVYPYLGPYRTSDDVEQARTALEKAYRDKGYPFVAVDIPPQKTDTGVIVLQVVKNEVGRLRVHGSRYFSLDEIKNEAPSLSEGTVPNFSQVTHDLGVLNEIPDRRITPSVQPGIVPGTVDVDLNVKDTFPMHGSLELNNRYSADTTSLRLNGSVDYDNLWQLGHTIGASFQVSPENISQVQVFSGYYLARIPDVSWLSLILEGTDQDSSVSTLGGIGVAGKGQTIGGRAVITLPSKTDYYHSVSLGFDYKHNDQNLTAAGTVSDTPVTYYPMSVSYSGTWLKKDVGETDLNASITANLQPISSDNAMFNLNRSGATGSFIYFRGDLSHTHELPEGFQIYGKVQGQASDQPLINNEQFSAGGLGTVRGYLESEVLGDNGILGTVEMRSPSLSSLIGTSVNEWRFYIFSDGGIVAIDEPLPEQQSTYRLASVGFGSRLKMLDHLNGSLDAAYVLDQGPDTNAYTSRLTFRIWADF
ncbi:MAG: hypothetical protein LV480_01845 [Methylacidiphilales bacterium]|nr:hypothetical protein [Candidatus Methylacidiphilales bacterium]